MYDRGRGVPEAPEDHAKAATWYRKAADKGYAAAQVMLGLKYELGDGVPVDYVQAHMWFNLAASNPSSDLLDQDTSICAHDVATKMTPDQIAEAQRMASEWKPKP